MSFGHPYPFVPNSFRQTAFDILHSLAHLGIRSMQALTGDRFVWPCMHRPGGPDLYCVALLQSPETSNLLSLPSHHMDLMRPLHVACVFSFLLMVADHAKHWPEAFPLASI